MNQNTLKNIIIGLLVVIIILLVIFYLYLSKAVPTPSTNTTSNSGVARGIPPVILDSPYLYDSGYWVSPDAWWMSSDAGNTYVHNNYKTNYYYDKATNTTKPIPTTTTASAITTAAPAITTAAPVITTAAMVSPGMLPPQPNLTPSATLSGIQEILPTGQLIAPSQNSVFPLPTLASPGNMQLSPDTGNMPALSPNTMQQLDQISMPPSVPPSMQSSMPPSMQPIMDDSMAAKVDIQASQLLGMRGGNNSIQEPALPEVAL
jgi:hypothetical protein